MSTARRLHYTYAEYLRALEMSGVKLEYCDGEIYARAGGTPAHADLAAGTTSNSQAWPQLFVSHGRPQITIVERVGATWSQRECRRGEDVVLSTSPLTFAVDELYEGIELEA